MTLDERIIQTRANLQAFEAELEARGDRRALRRVKMAHAVLEDVADDYVASGDVAALSVGGDKPELP